MGCGERQAFQPLGKPTDDGLDLAEPKNAKKLFAALAD